MDLQARSLSNDERTLSLPFTIEYSQPSRTGGDKEVLAVHININAHYKYGTRWKAAFKEIEAIMRASGVNDTILEIHDEDRVYQPQYKSVREDLLRCIYARLESSWKFLSLYEVGRASDLKQPTVVLLVDPLAKRRWSELLEELKQIMLDSIDQDSTLGEVLPVEIIPGKWSELPSNTKWKGFWDRAINPPRQGTSIGVQGRQEAGLSEGTHRGFLTISNAVAPPSAAFDLNSSRPCAQTEGDLPAANVQYLAQQDCNESIKSGKRHLKSYGARLSEAEAEEKESRAKADSTSHTLARLQECTQGYRDMVHTVKQQINQVEQIPVNLGRTILASQHYAFVETTALPHAIDNTLPEVSLVHACADPEELGLKKPVMYIAMDDNIKRFENVIPGKFYFKQGRTTSITSGICNGVEAWFRPGTRPVDWSRTCTDVVSPSSASHSDNTTNSIPNPKPASPLPCYKAIHTIHNAPIVAEPPHIYIPKPHSPFCDAGDNGALVLNRRGELAGLLWGSMESWCGPPSMQNSQTHWAGAGMVDDIQDVMLSMGREVGWGEEGEKEGVLRLYGQDDEPLERTIYTH
ncbi:MAG: hypothetical protein Q9221_001078 [Calogaya cf. arnoldii]